MSLRHQTAGLAVSSCKVFARNINLSLRLTIVDLTIVDWRKSTTCCEYMLRVLLIFVKGQSSWYCSSSSASTVAVRWLSCFEYCALAIMS